MIVNYHRIERVYFNFLDNKIIVRVLSYKDKSYREKEKLMTKSKEEADHLYNLLSSETSILESYQRESYENKLMKLVDILKDNINDNYYIHVNEVEFWDIFDFQNINYIYNKLKELDFYSNAKEV